LSLSSELGRSYTRPSDSDIVIASNPQGFSTSHAKFEGPIGAVPFSEMEMIDFLKRNLALKP
jgi:hypothetical protein